MSDKPENPPAFPMTAVYDPNRQTVYPSGEFGAHGGMTLRDYFAAAALQGMITASFSSSNKIVLGKGPEADNNDDLARVSYELADAMLNARAA